MKATIESTAVITTVDGHPARVWKGTTLEGVPFVACISYIAVSEAEDRAQFEEELLTREPPQEISLDQVLVLFDLRKLL